MTETYKIHNNVAPPTMDTILERKTIPYTRFFLRNTFSKAGSMFLEISSI